MKKVAIVGYTLSRDLAPFTDPDFEVWGLNDLYKHIPRYDRWFQIHTEQEVQRCHLANPAARDTWEAQKQALSQMKCPVYMQDVHPEIPVSVRFPLQEMFEHFGECFVNPKHAEYFTNSISYMIALAIYEQFDEIHVYGVDMATTMADGEYAHQRPSCEFWLGIAAGRGIKLHIPDEADLLKSRFLYGYEDEKRHVFETKIKTLQTDLANKKAQAKEQQQHWRNHEMQYTGAETALKEVMLTWQ